MGSTGRDHGRPRGPSSEPPVRFITHPISAMTATAPRINSKDPDWPPVGPPPKSNCRIIVRVCGRPGCACHRAGYPQAHRAEPVTRDAHPAPAAVLTLDVGPPGSRRSRCANDPPRPGRWARQWPRRSSGRPCGRIVGAGGPFLEGDELAPLSLSVVHGSGGGSPVAEEATTRKRVSKTDRCRKIDAAVGRNRHIAAGGEAGTRPSQTRGAAVHSERH